MLERNHSTVEEMYKNLQEEVENLNKELEANLSRIAEIDEYISYVYKQEDEDFKVFSPRNVETVFKDSLTDNKTEKYKLESDNRLLYSKLNKITSYLACLDEAKQNSVYSKENNLQVLDMQEKERQRIARDLHDTSLQNLAHLIHKIELASLYIDKDTIQAKLELETVSNNLKQVIEDIRGTVFNLRPMHFDDLGLKETFENFYKTLKDANKQFDFYISIDDIKSEHDLVLMNIYRIVQEASENAVKHSRGNKLFVDIKKEFNIYNICVKDNGCGFELDDSIKENEKHYGIAIMKERVQLLGGTISITSKQNEGTEIKVTIPNL